MTRIKQVTRLQAQINQAIQANQQEAMEPCDPEASKSIVKFNPSRLAQ